MLRLLRDRLLVSLAPERVALARVTGWRTPSIITKQVVDCDPQFGPEPWQGAISALSGLIEPLRSARADVTIVLSNHFVRYLIVPFDPAVKTADEARAFARFHLVKAYGDRAKTWEVRLSPARRGAARLVAAIDTGLMQAGRALFPKGRGIRLVSMQPYLMSAFNLAQQSLKKQDLWLLLVEPQRACVALLSGGVWTSVYSPRGEFSSTEHWVTLLERQQVLGATSTSREVLVHAPAKSSISSDSSHGWQFQRLTPPSIKGYLPLEDDQLAVAVTSQ